MRPGRGTTPARRSAAYNARMSNYTIAVLVGSLRRESFNKRLARAVIKLLPADFTARTVDIGALPLYDQDQDKAQSEAVVQMKAVIATTQGLLFVTPEYNRSIPGVLKNAIDHGSRPYGHSVWSGKPAGVIGITPGTMGTAMAQQHLRNVLAHLDVAVLGQPEIFLRSSDDFLTADDSIGTDHLAFMQKWADRYAAWIRQHAAATG